jgi:hypothetical protein
MYRKFLEIKNQLDELTQQLDVVKREIWSVARYNNNINLKGSKTFDDDGFKVTITHGETVKVDNKLAALRPDLFKVKYEFDRTQYKNLVTEQRDIVDEAMVITKIKPQFKVEML